MENGLLRCCTPRNDTDNITPTTKSFTNDTPLVRATSALLSAAKRQRMLPAITAVSGEAPDCRASAVQGIGGQKKRPRRSSFGSSQPRSCDLGVPGMPPALAPRSLSVGLLACASGGLPPRPAPCLPGCPVTGFRRRMTDPALTAAVSLFSPVRARRL
jgi:hypothetical protein